MHYVPAKYPKYRAILTTRTSGPTQAPPHRTKPEKAWMRAVPQRRLRSIEPIVSKLIAAVYDEWPDVALGSREAAWDSCERASDRLRRKIRNADAAFLADVINYALFCTVSRALGTNANVVAKHVAHTMLLADLERHTRERSLRPEIDVIVAHIRDEGFDGESVDQHL